MAGELFLAASLALTGTCPTLSTIHGNEGQHIFYNCIVEFKLHSELLTCESGRCIGSVYLTDTQRGNSLTINVSGSSCLLGGLSGAGVSFENTFSVGSHTIEEYMGFSLGNDGRLISVVASTSSTIDNSRTQTRIECMGSNPIRRENRRKR